MKVRTLIGRLQMVDPDIDVLAYAYGDNNDGWYSHVDAIWIEGDNPLDEKFCVIGPEEATRVSDFRGLPGTIITKNYKQL